MTENDRNEALDILDEIIERIRKPRSLLELTEFEDSETLQTSIAIDFDDSDAEDIIQDLELAKNNLEDACIYFNDLFGLT